MCVCVWAGGDFPGGSDGKESTCNAGDLGWILGLGKVYIYIRVCVYLLNICRVQRCDFEQRTKNSDLSLLTLAVTLLCILHSVSCTLWRGSLSLQSLCLLRCCGYQLDIQPLIQCQGQDMMWVSLASGGSGVGQCTSNVKLKPG